MAKNPNQNKNYRKQSQKKQRREIAAFTKRVDNVDELLEVISKLPGEAHSILTEGGEIDSFETLLSRIVNIFYSNIPNIINSENTFWSLNMSMDKTFLKTGKFVGIGWIINKTFSQKTRKFEIESIDVRFVSYDKMHMIDEINELFELGFEEVSER